MDGAEAYCGGRLVRQVEMVDVGGAWSRFSHHYVPGRYTWLLDGAEVTEERAQQELSAAGEGARAD